MYSSTSNAQKSPVMLARLEDCTGCRSNHPVPSDDVRNESDLLSKCGDGTIAARMEESVPASCRAGDV